MRKATKAIALSLAAVLAALLTAGCPPPTDDTQTQYDQGFMDGFNEDDWYWTGWLDSWETENTLLYQGDQIENVEDPPYDSGYWDGVWYAYHDGYFVSYKFGFIVGFSEGYDTDYGIGLEFGTMGNPAPYIQFLADDDHIERLDGSFLDGYHDGFTEGRVFGAADYEANIDFDWLGALLDYESGVDLYFDEVQVGTGQYGPAILYEWGTNPFDLKKALRKAFARHATPSIRGAKDINVDELELYRTLPTDIADALDVSYTTSLRSNRELFLMDTWLDRIEDYLAVGNKGTTNAAPQTATASKRADSPRARAADKAATK